MIGGIIFTASLFGPAMTIMSLAPGLAVIGVGMGFAMSQIGNLTLSAAKPEETNEASGLHNTFLNLGRSIGTAAVGAFVLFFFLSGLAGGVDSSVILPEQNKNELTVLITEVSEGMESENLEAEVKETLGSYPDEYITELQDIKDHSAGDSMRQTFYVLAGIMGAGLVISLFVSKEKLVTESDTKKNKKPTS